MSFYLWAILYFVVGLVLDSVWLACVWAVRPEEKGQLYPESYSVTRVTHALNVVLWPVLFIAIVGAVVVVSAKHFVLKLTGFFSRGLRRIVVKEEEKKKEERERSHVQSS